MADGIVTASGVASASGMMFLDSLGVFALAPSHRPLVRPLAERVMSRNGAIALAGCARLILLQASLMLDQLKRHRPRRCVGQVLTAERAPGVGWLRACCYVTTTTLPIAALPPPKAATADIGRSACKALHAAAFLEAPTAFAARH